MQVQDSLSDLILLQKTSSGDAGILALEEMCVMNFLVSVSYVQQEYDSCKVCTVIDTDDQVKVEIMRVSVVQMSNEN